ncbi:hypothetical protein FGO68_gene13258 [Halteria grandinella]|uniref:Uncharacterized protein n=1 Tax=Halteria grandinella TaxID=5974 RepID=A0A8J8T0B3_HALGN|nr:hypothetical protein FGO68_gene13258 [Halteria grandinella]
MITSALFAGYAFGVGAITYNLTRTKLQDDFENDVRKLREYDFGHETINTEKDLPIKCIILAKYNPADNTDLRQSDTKLAQKGEKVLFSQVTFYSTILDPTKYLEYNFKGKDSFKLTFKADDVQQYPLDVEFRGKSKLFDLETLGQEKEYMGQSLSDRVKRIYYQSLRKRDFAYMENGMLANKEHEYLIAGTLDLDKSSKRLVMRRPELVIGSDRLDFYDFLGRRRESFNLQNRNWLKFCVGLTFAHFLVVRVPTLFSKYFGDQVGVIGETLGAQDQSETAEKIRRFKLAQQNKGAQ